MSLPKEPPPLRNYLEYSVAKGIEEQLREKKKISGLSDNEEKELTELAKRVTKFTEPYYKRLLIKSQEDAQSH